MMDAIRQWALTLCITAVAGAIAQMLLPSGNVQKVCKIVISTFFLCCMILPFFQVRGDLKLDFQGMQVEQTQVSARMQDQLSEQTIRQAQEILRREINGQLERMGVEKAQIHLNMNTSVQDQIYISELSIGLDSEGQDKRPQITEYAVAELGVEPVFYTIP